MDLLVDVGNTQVKFTKVEGGLLTNIERCLTSEFLDNIGQYSNIKRIMLVSVANQNFSQSLQTWAEQHDVEFTQVNTQSETFGIKNSYLQYSTMGADRWLAVLAAEALYPNKNILIIDAGTATTFDLLDANKQHQGGWILPGVDMMMQSLFQNTDKVFGETGVIDTLAFGKSTADNVKYGAWSTTAGAVQTALSIAQQQNLTIDEIILTGGYGEELEKLCKQLGLNNCHFIEQLIFVGLQRFL